MLLSTIYNFIVLELNMNQSPRSWNRILTFTKWLTQQYFGDSYVSTSLLLYVETYLSQLTHTGFGRFGRITRIKYTTLNLFAPRV